MQGYNLRGVLFVKRAKGLPLGRICVNHMTCWRAVAVGQFTPRLQINVPCQN